MTGNIEDIMEPKRSPEEKRSFLTVVSLGHTFGTQYNFESDAGAVMKKKNRPIITYGQNGGNKDSRYYQLDFGSMICVFHLLLSYQVSFS